jgi:hypothetical protein
MENMKRVFYFLMCITLALPIVSCGKSSKPQAPSYIEEARALGFPTGDIHRWIMNAMEQNNCQLVEVTSVKADGEWCLKLYVDVLWYRSFREEGEPHKAVVSLWFEPSNGRIWDGAFDPLD